MAAAKAFAGAGFDLIEDENIQAIVENIRQDMTANIYQSLVDRGLQLWNAGNKTEAMDYFQASLTIKPDNPRKPVLCGASVPGCGRHGQCQFHV